MNGDTVKALRAIKAKTLIMTGTKDLLNPEWEPQDAARFIRDVRVMTINPGTVVCSQGVTGMRNVELPNPASTGIRPVR